MLTYKSDTVKLTLILSSIIIFLFFIFWIREFKNVTSVQANSWTEDMEGDCAVVLTGGRGRVKDGLALLARGSIRKLIISGVFEKSNLKDIFPELSYLSSVDTEDVILEKFSQTTYGNALQTRTLVDALKCRDLILITHQTHMYRAYKTFKANFPNTFPIQKRALISGSHEHLFSDSMEESLKSLFYSAWTY